MFCPVPLVAFGSEKDLNEGCFFFLFTVQWSWLKKRASRIVEVNIDELRGQDELRRSGYSLTQHIQTRDNIAVYPLIRTSQVV